MMSPADWDDEPYEHEDGHYLEDDDYEAFVERELDGRGGLRRTPPIGLIIGALVLVLLVIALLLAR